MFSHETKKHNLPEILDPNNIGIKFVNNFLTYIVLLLTFLVSGSYLFATFFSLEKKERFSITEFYNCEMEASTICLGIAAKIEPVSTNESLPHVNLIFNPYQGGATSQFKAVVLNSNFDELKEETILILKTNTETAQLDFKRADTELMVTTGQHTFLDIILESLN